MNAEVAEKIVREAALGYFEVIGGFPSGEWQGEELRIDELKKQFIEAGIPTKDHPLPEEPSEDDFRALLEKRSVDAGKDSQTLGRLLSILDMLWMTHLENLDALSESVGLRAYGQKDPLVEYRQEAHRLYKDFWVNFNAWIFGNLFKMLSGAPQVSQAPIRKVLPANIASNQNPHADKVGRNDPCPCGSGKKYKKCHGA